MKRSRVGAPMTFTIHDKGLSTMIDWRNRDSYGRAISSKNRAQALPAPEVAAAYSCLERDRAEPRVRSPKAGPDGVCARPARNVRETAAVVYRDAVNKNPIRGRSIEGVAAALYAACRQCSVPRTLDGSRRSPCIEEGDRAHLPVHIARLRLSFADVPDRLRPALLLGPEPEGEVQSRAVEILRQAGEREPRAAEAQRASLQPPFTYRRSFGGERRTQREVAEVAGVTEVTIRNRYKELAEKLDIEIIL